MGILSREMAEQSVAQENLEATRGWDKTEAQSLGREMVQKKDGKDSGPGIIEPCRKQ